MTEEESLSLLSITSSKPALKGRKTKHSILMAAYHITIRLVTTVTLLS